ncbi:MAG: polysaccharide biosynthesis protein, partial [Thaumarchaeota archaeon]|nr:polysaccharide biosynthesis protein [Nitrososphaerota archaeon]
FLLGFVFVVLVSRNLSQGDLGAWFFIGSMLSYFQIFEKVLPYWVIRDSARGAKLVRTSVTSNALISIPLFIGFLIASSTVADVVKVDVFLFLIASLLLPVYYIQAPLTSVIYARYPHLASLRNPIIDGVKIPLALLLLPYGLKGVLIAVILANMAYLAYSIIVVRKEVEDKLRLDWLKKRLRHIWLPLFQSASGYISSASDSFLVGVLLSPTDLAYYGIGLTISNAIRSSRQLSLPFSVKLISKGETSRREMRSLLKFISIFVIPMLIGGILLAPGLFRIFGKIYMRKAWILPPLLIAAALTTYSSAFKGLLKGLEKIDRNLEVGYKELLRSMLFIVDSMDYVFAAMIIALSLLLVPYMGGFGAAIGRLIASLTIFIILAYMSRRYLPSREILPDLAKICIACLPMAIFLISFKPASAIMTLASVAIGAAIYFITLYIVDSESRTLVKFLIKEFSEKIISFA